jgi:hypothetical protein
MKNKTIGAEPKKDNRFIVEFKGTTIEPWTVTKADRPTYTLDTGWDDMSFELIDLIGPSTSKKIFDEIVEKNMRDCSISLRMLDPVGETVETWTLSGDYISVDFGAGDYGKDEISKIKINFKIKNCMLS